MEFTKSEQKILSPKYEKREKLKLWAGILFLCLSIALIPYVISQVNEVKDIWEEARLTFNQNIEPTTELEIKLKSLYHDLISDHKELWFSYLTEKSLRMVLIFFFVGCILTGSYFRSRTYIKLIRKLQQT